MFFNNQFSFLFIILVAPMKLIHFDKWRIKLIFLAGITVMLLGAGALAAQAQSAITSEAVNLRYGPGAHYLRITTLPRSASVHIDYCRTGWCQIRTSWGIGWVNSRYLLQTSQFAAKETRDDLAQPVTPEVQDSSQSTNNEIFYDRYYHSYYRLYDGYWYYLGRRQGYRPDYWFYDPYYKWRK